MSDILEKMVSVEKEASALVAEAEAEAERRKSAARHEGEKSLAAAQAEGARQSAERLAAETAALKAERDRRVAEYREALAARPQDRDALRKAALALVGAR